jgi:AcrR family transcriptional regulator
MDVSAVRQEGVLAGTHQGERGLPRGRSGLPTEAVRAAQRERLLRAVIAATAQTGFRDVTVADIVRGARVSRAAFYAHFADKEECFLAATRKGGEMMGARVLAATRALPAAAAAEDSLRASIAAFLEFLVDEPAFARAFYIEMPAGGPGAIAQLERAHRSFARLNRAWHERARQDNPGWPVVPDQAYYALAGASAELVRAHVRNNEISTVTVLIDTLVALHLAVMAAKPWTTTG